MLTAATHTFKYHQTGICNAKGKTSHSCVFRMSLTQIAEIVSAKSKELDQRGVVDPDSQLGFRNMTAKDYASRGILIQAIRDLEKLALGPLDALNILVSNVRTPSSTHQLHNRLTNPPTSPSTSPASTPSRATTSPTTSPTPAPPSPPSHVHSTSPMRSTSPASSATPSPTASSKSPSPAASRTPASPASCTTTRTPSPWCSS